MKKLYWGLYPFLFLLIFTACKKEDQKSIAPASKKTTALSFKSTDQIPNEIVPLLYQRLIQDKLYDQAENLKTSYYNTLAIRLDDHKDLLKGIAKDLSSARGTVIAAANLPTRPVPDVSGGVVLAGGWETTSGYTSSHLQAIGTVDINFEAMNGSAPDVAYPSGAPNSSQIMGTTGQSRRMEAFRLPFIRFAAVDNLGITYYTGSFGFTYQAHVQALGWLSYISSNLWAGTMNQSRRMEAVHIYGPGYNNSSYTLTFNDPAPSTQAKLYIFYRVHIGGVGWEDWKAENATAGIPGLSRQIEAMQVRAYLVKV